MKLYSITMLVFVLLISSISVFAQEDNTTIVEFTNFTIANVIPQEFKLGDSQFNIQLENTGTVKLKNLVAVISGSGFSTYNVLPVDVLNPGDKSYIIVNGNFKEAGLINLNIRINDKTFNQEVNVIDSNAGKSQSDEEKKKIIDELSVTLSDLENKYNLLEEEYNTKKSGSYDLSSVDFSDLKEFLRTAKVSIAVGDADKARANILLLSNEYNDQKNKLDNVVIVKKSFWSVIKSNLLLISSIGGSIITIFALYELLKKKKQDISKKALEVKVIFEKKKKDDDKKDEEKKNQ